MTVSLKAQAAAVERAVVNLRGHVDNLQNLCGMGRRPMAELDMARTFLADLEPAARTMAWLLEHEATVRAAVERKSEAA
jgi:hypothetical protein